MPRSNPSRPTHGLLTVPAGAEVITAEPGILHRVKTRSKSSVFKGNCYLFGKPPLHKQTEYRAAQSTREEENIISLTAKNGANENLIIEAALTNDQEIIAQPFEYPDPQNPHKKIIHPFIVQAAAFKRVPKRRADMPESGNEIEVVAIGYMYKDDLQPVEKFRKFSTPIFNALPEKKDVVQSGLGDCFFLSTLNAILSANEREVQVGASGIDFIQGMMKQLNDGTVVVRLFDPRNLEPVYVKVEASEHMINGVSAVAHGQPWVHILEKAYAGLAFKNITSQDEYRSMEGKYIVTLGSLLSMYGKGGDTAVAMTILTGEKVKEVRLMKLASTLYPLNTVNTATIFKTITDSVREVVFDHPDPDLAKILEPSADFDLQKFHEAARALSNYITRTMKNPTAATWLPDSNSSLFQALEGNEALIRELGLYIFLIAINYRETNQQFNAINNETSFTREDLLKRVEKLSQLVPPPPAAVLDKLVTYISESHPSEKAIHYRFHGNLLSGEYTAYEYQKFFDLKNAVLAGKILTASTPEHFAEGDVAGLVSGHVYTIMNVFEKEQNGKTILCVKMRNPWKRVGRAYDHANGSPEAVRGEAGEFDLDITDFLKYFESYVEGEIPTPEQLTKRHQDMVSREAAENVAIIAKNFETLTHDDQEAIIKALLAKGPGLQQAFCSAQSDAGLYAMRRFLQYSVFNLERQILARYDLPSILNQTENETPFAMLSSLNERNTLLNRIENFAIKKSVKEYEIFERERLNRKKLRQALVPNERFESLSDYIRRKDHERVGENSLLMTSFKLIETQEKRADFIFDLLTEPIYIIKACLQNQSLQDLFELVKAIEASLVPKKEHRYDNAHKQIKEMLHTYIGSEETLLHLVKDTFTAHLKSSMEFQFIKANADLYLKEKFHGSSLQQLKFKCNTFFCTTENEKFLTMYQHHLMYTASARIAHTPNPSASAAP